MTGSRRRHRQDKTDSSCVFRRCEQNWRQVKTVGNRKFRNCVNRVLSCLNSVSNFQLGRVCKRVHTADRTGQNCSVSNIFRNTENSLDLSPILFTPPTRQDKTVLSCPSRWCELGIRMKITEIVVSSFKSTSFAFGFNVCALRVYS